jgi:hypothetical protein
MREVWHLPKEEDAGKTEDEWVILDNQIMEMRSKLLFLWWMVWHLRNDTIFGIGDASINNSA